MQGGCTSVSDETWVRQSIGPRPAKARKLVRLRQVFTFEGLTLLKGSLSRVTRTMALPIEMLFVTAWLSMCCMCPGLRLKRHSVSGCGRVPMQVTVVLIELVGISGRTGLKTLLRTSCMLVGVLIISAGVSMWCVGLSVLSLTMAVLCVWVLVS